MTSTTPRAESAIVRPLPVGHDDPDSSYWIAPEYRDAYQRVTVSPRALQDALNERRQLAVRESDLALWEENRRHKEQTSKPENYQTWLRTNTNPDGTPSLRNIRHMDGVTFRHWNDVHQLTAEQVNEVTFAVTLRAARGVVRGAELAAQRKAEREHANTCSICCTLRPELDGKGPQPCPDCDGLVQLLRSAGEPLAGGGTRLDAVLTYVAATTTPSTSEPAVTPTVDDEPSAQPSRSGGGGLLSVLRLRA